VTRTASWLLRQRLHNQHLDRARLRSAADVVAHFGAVQSQDYAGARWAVGQRMARATDADIERAFDAGEILRTHVLRPTWHFVAPADIRWILGLSGPRVHAGNALYYRRNGLDPRTLTRARKVIERALGDGHPLTRTELASALARARIPASGERLAYVMMHNELDGVICSGPRRGKQFTYALLDARAPRVRPVLRAEALALLTRRYFTSHGPATVRDFAWWSGLRMADARTGVEMLGTDLTTEDIGGLQYCCLRDQAGADGAIAGALLLPNYDEFLIAYRDREIWSDGSRRKPRGPDRFPYHLLVDGRLAGSWRPVIARSSVKIEIATYDSPTAKTRRAIGDAVERYGAFIGRPLVFFVRGMASRRGPAC